jgi:hypothetical protein
MEGNSDENIKYWKKIYKNISMSAVSGAAGMRTDNNPKLSGRLRKGNQSTKRHEISITIQDIKEMWEKQEGRCYWTNCTMSLDDLFISHSPFAPSADRLDNKRGYHKDNVVLTLRFTNKGRGGYNNLDFKERLNQILESRNVT